ncbi:MAG TPA: methylenetetrahydrofolate reductase [NAD(P)H] [Paenalcaligenes sp.]|nr:methylenetetrahydrofolate reductase [NAD(P)H] [Paenalcaligenes sp.]
MSSFSLSAEFFPPRDIAARERLLRAAKALMGSGLEFISVTFGAGGSTQQGTVQTLESLQKLGFEVVPHLSCIGTTQETLLELLDYYKSLGVRRLVVLRGDIPSGMGGFDGPMRYARDLVLFIREHYGEHFQILVAAYPEMHPEAESFSADIHHYVQKVKAGSDAAITQYFFNAAAYADFMERTTQAGAGIPVIPGIMPITNAKQILRFSAMCGADVPRWIQLRLQDFGDDRQSIRAFGIDVATQLSAELIEMGAPGLHFYALNQAEATLSIMRNLNLHKSQAAAV